MSKARTASLIVALALSGCGNNSTPSLTDADTNQDGFVSQEERAPAIASIEAMNFQPGAWTISEETNNSNPEEPRRDTQRASCLDEGGLGLKNLLIRTAFANSLSLLKSTPNAACEYRALKFNENAAVIQIHCEEGDIQGDFSYEYTASPVRIDAQIKVTQSNDIVGYKRVTAERTGFCRDLSGSS